MTAQIYYLSSNWNFHSILSGLQPDAVPRFPKWWCVKHQVNCVSSIYQYPWMKPLDNRNKGNFKLDNSHSLVAVSGLVCHAWAVSSSGGGWIIIKEGPILEGVTVAMPVAVAGMHDFHCQPFLLLCGQSSCSMRLVCTSIAVLVLSSLLSIVNTRLNTRLLSETRGANAQFRLYEAPPLVARVQLNKGKTKRLRSFFWPSN